MTITAPDPLKTLSRTPSGLGTLPASPLGVDRKKSAWNPEEPQPGENFSHLLSRQKIATTGKAAAEDGPHVGEAITDYLNRRNLPAAAKVDNDIAPQPGESTSQFFNRVQVVKPKDAAAMANINTAAVASAKAAPAVPPIDIIKQATPIAPAPASSLLSPVAAGNPLNHAVTTIPNDLNHAVSADSPDEAAAAKARAEKAAGDLAANALILPMLKQLRRSPWGQNTVFSGGIGEKSFGPEFDMQIADRIAHSPRLGVTQALSGRLMQRKTQDATKLSDAKKLDVHG